MQLEYENLIGKPWVANRSDCLTLGQNFFKQNFDIDIPDIARPIDWDADKLDLFRAIYPKAGFQLMHDWDDLRPADVLCTCFHSSNPNHIVIYLGDNEILHHKFGMHSTKETFRPAWLNVTGYILRHPNVPDLRPQLPDANIEDLIRARFQLQV